MVGHGVYFSVRAVTSTLGSPGLRIGTRYLKRPPSNRFCEAILISQMTISISRALVISSESSLMRFSMTCSGGTAASCGCGI